MLNDNDNTNWEIRLPWDGFAANVTAATGAASESTPGFTVQPGTYQLRGFLITQAATPPPHITTGADAVSAFFGSLQTTGSYEAIPEPSTLGLVTLGGILAFRRRRC